MRRHIPAVPPNMGRALGGVLEAASKVSAGELGKAHILRDRFAGQVAAAFQDIDVLLVPVWPTPMPSAAEWDEMAKGDIAQLLALRGTVQFDRDAGADHERRL